MGIRYRTQLPNNLSDSYKTHSIRETPEGDAQSRNKGQQGFTEGELDFIHTVNTMLAKNEAKNRLLRMAAEIGRSVG